MADAKNDKHGANDFEGERAQTDALAPENENSEQVDSYEQSQTVAQDAIDRATSVLGTDSTHVESAFNAPDAQDLVDHMIQMKNGNTVDMSAFAGEPKHDDNVDKYGEQSKLDG